MSKVTLNEKGLKVLLHDDYKIISVEVVNNNRVIIIEYEEVN